MPLQIRVKSWHAAASWTWNAGDDVCGICRMPYDGCPSEVKFPGDDSPVVWGVCTHAFHLQCINRWITSDAEQRCPICRHPWEFKTAAQPQQQQGGGGAAGADGGGGGGGVAGGGGAGDATPPFGMDSEDEDGA